MSSKVWLVSRTYQKDMVAVKTQPLYKEHLGYQDELSAKGKIKIGFRALDGTSAWHFFIDTEQEEEVAKMVEGDPLFTNGYYTYKINEVGKLRGSW